MANNGNGDKDGVTELEGHEFNIVKKGLDKVQVAAFINELVRQRDELISERDKLLKREEHMLSLTKLAERTVIEADKLTAEMKKEAIEQAKIEADKLTEETKREAIEQAKTEADAIMAKAKERSQEQTQQIYGQLLSQ